MVKPNTSGGAKKTTTQLGKTSEAPTKWYDPSTWFGGGESTIDEDKEGSKKNKKNK